MKLPDKKAQRSQTILLVICGLCAFLGLSDFFLRFAYLERMMIPESIVSPVREIAWKCI